MNENCEAINEIEFSGRNSQSGNIPNCSEQKEVKPYENSFLGLSVKKTGTVSSGKPPDHEKKPDGVAISREGKINCRNTDSSKTNQSGISEETKNFKDKMMEQVNNAKNKQQASSEAEDDKTAFQEPSWVALSEKAQKNPTQTAVEHKEENKSETNNPGDNLNKKISSLIENQKSIKQKLDALTENDRKAAQMSGINAYNMAINNGFNEKKALNKAEEAIKSKVTSIQKDQSNIDSMKKSIEKNSAINKHIGGINDKSSVYNKAEEAYRKARATGKNEADSLKAGKDEALNYSKELEKDLKRNNEIENLDKNGKERVSSAKEKAEKKAVESKLNDEEKEKSVKKEIDNELERIRNENSVINLKNKMPESDQKSVEETAENAYKNAISLGKDEASANDERTNAALKAISEKRASLGEGLPKEALIYQSIVKDAAKKYGVEPHIINAIITNESNYNPEATSEVGAHGLMQMMPETAEMMGVSDPSDPRDNIMGGTKYFKQMLDQFKDLDLAVAAYNSGPGNVKKYGGIPPFDETQKYVRNVSETYKKLRGF